MILGLLGLALFVFVGLVVVFGPAMALFCFGLDRDHGISYFLCVCGAVTWMVLSGATVAAVVSKSGWFS